MDKKPFISILIPCSNEQPGQVLATIHSCLNQTYDSYEVIVIDNNTIDQKLSIPLSEIKNEKYKYVCIQTDIKTKASALVIGLKHCNPATDYIALVDSDYIVSPIWIEDAIDELMRCNATNTSIAGVQYPQAYRDSSHSIYEIGATIEQKIFSEFLQWFNSYNHGAVRIVQGTMCLISYSALQSIGGFDIHSICEDTDIALRLSVQGASIQYRHKVMGYGTAPQNLTELVRQRERWVEGSMHLIKKYIFSPRSSICLTVRFSYLSYWLFWLLHILYPIFIALGFFGTTLLLREERYLLPMEFSVFPLYIFTSVTIIAILTIYRLSAEVSVRKICSALYCGLLLTPIITISAYKGLFTHHAKFNTTRSVVHTPRSSIFNLSYYFYIWIVLMLIMQIYFLLHRYGLQYKEVLFWIATLTTLTLPLLTYIIAFTIDSISSRKL